MRCLVLVLISLDAQMLFGMTKADPGCFISVCSSLSVKHASQIDELLHLLDGLSADCKWSVGGGIDLHQLRLLSVDVEACPG